MTPTDMTMEELGRRLASIDDDTWLALLVESLNHRRLDGIQFPGFPPDELQRMFVGSAGAQALKEAFVFYRFMKQRAAALGRPIGTGTRLLDFGCGWGRFLRLFWKDVGAANLYGCDVNQTIVELCRSLGVPGQLHLIEANGTLPYPDSYFDAILAYSVFTHLPEPAHLRWLPEFERVARPGCVVCLTVQPRRFIDDIAALPAAPTSDWQARLRRFAPSVPQLHANYDRGDLIFLPTNPGHEATYGDALVPLRFLEKHWSHSFHIREYLDDPWVFQQAAVVLQRR